MASASVELDSHIKMAFTAIEHSEQVLKNVMRTVYRDLDNELKQSSAGLPKGITKKGRWRIITFPGNPRDPGIALKPDGGFTYIRWGFSRSPNQWDLPITGPRYFELVIQTLKLLQR